MHRNRINQQTTREVSNVWTALKEVALSDWASTARFALLLLVNQCSLGLVIVLISHR
jgi:hypothetical protein